MTEVGVLNAIGVVSGITFSFPDFPDRTRSFSATGRTNDFTATGRDLADFPNRTRIKGATGRTNIFSKE